MCSATYVLALIPMHSAKEYNLDLVSRFGRWLRVLDFTIETERRYMATAKLLCQFLDEMAATEATHLDIRDFLATVARAGIKRATIHRAMCALRCFFDFLNLGGLINWSPPRFVRLRRVERHVPRVLTEKQMRLLLAATHDLQERAMLEVIYGTGARAGEVRSMRVEDVDLEARRIRVIGKCGERFVLFPRSIAPHLRRYIGNRHSGYLFVSRGLPRKLKLWPGKDGNWRSCYYKFDREKKRSVRVHWCAPRALRLNYDQAMRRLKRQLPKSVRDLPIGQKCLGTTTVRYVLMRIGLRVRIHVNPHLIRHTFATHLMDHGADIRMIQIMLGHRSVGTTQIYTHVSMSQAQKVLDKCHPRNL
jgi:site-specific recombinase XerD